MHPFEIFNYLVFNFGSSELYGSDAPQLSIECCIEFFATHKQFQDIQLDYFNEKEALMASSIVDRWS